MKPTTIVYLITLIFLLVGCATREIVGYQMAQKYEFGYGIGVSETELDESQYRITSAGTVAEDDDLLVGWLVRRAIELCGSRNFNLELALPRVAFHRPSSNGTFPDKTISGVVQCR